jgi:hypothetical protein
MANVRINPNLEAELTGRLLGTRLETHGPMERVLGGVADQIAAQAQAIGRAEFYRTGDYVRGIEADVGLSQDGELVGRVVATDWKSHWAEWGWLDRAGGRRARHVLTRAAERAGYAAVGPGLFAGAGGGGRRALPSPRRMAAITGR